MIIDAFMYYNEQEALRIRLNELYDTVDYFVIVEATETFTGKKKPLYYNDLPDWINAFESKVVRYKTDLPNTLNHWGREKFQRNKLYDAVSSIDGITGDSIVVLSDADEIPNKTAVVNVGYETVQLAMKQYFWTLTWQVPEHRNQGGRPVITRYGNMDDHSPHNDRINSELTVVGPHGWHFSFLDHGARSKDKIEAFSHVEYNTDIYKSKAHIEKCIAEGIDPFDRFPLKYTPIDNTYPTYIQATMEQ